MNLPRDEMAFRSVYEPLLLARGISCVFRPGVRHFPAWRGYRQGEVVTARVIAVPGADELLVPPQFNGVRIPIRISDIKVAQLRDLQPEDFAGSSPDVFDHDSLERHLMAIYRKPLAAFHHVVTRIRFDYLD